MKRRGFLASLLGLAAAPVVGLLPAKAPLDMLSAFKYSDSPSVALAYREMMAKAQLTVPAAVKYWYDKSTRTIKFRRYTPYEIHKVPGTST